jgi:quinol monooxygenase YgiN
MERERCVMALAMLAEIPDLTREQYESVVRKVNEAGSPVGAVFHAGGPIEGGYRVVEVWESREAADTFYASDVYREAAAVAPSQPNILMTWAISGVDRGSGWQPAD